ncbi:putative rho gtpase activator [Erysiphe neolycopersici]|uniref:Putative rho gtpase activator n=1 Tax=Erysiphe neolycopersici TaxID=212602 RepID=A0A420HT82_9PEZI|nr:putative rho gtpase activator [Erysiphe neolycopersici]
MTRKSVPPQPLKLTDPKSNNEHSNSHENASLTPSPISPTAKSSSRSPFKFNSKKVFATTESATQSERVSRSGTEYQYPTPSSPLSQTAFSLTSLSISTVDQEGHERREKPSRSIFFSNYKASRSLSRLQIDSSKKLLTPGESMAKDTEKTGLVSHRENLPTDPTLAEFSLNLRSDSPPPPTSSSNNSKKSKQKSFTLLSRSHSSRDEQVTPETSEINLDSEKVQTQPEVTVLPAPVEQERSYRAMIVSNVRQHSSERIPSFHRDRSKDRSKEHCNKNVKESSNSKSQIISNLHRDINKNPASFSSAGGSNNFLYNLKSQATKGAGALSKGLFGKGTRGNGNIIDKPSDIDDENYELKVINLPLVQQTRLTRISKKLEDSRDKTEFWMPAFPWRAIDYLNYKGSDVEGLYRVPGSGPEIKKWRRRFDQELDINLFEQDDLYDINIIGSMLKAWLRELPDELLPKIVQDRIARECADSEEVPKLLVDELSNLSPFNYYLLFAITCHLSLLLAHSDKNKMDYRNLCICFQPCMKIDAVCFRFLVCNWRDCWKGCKTEPFYIEQEYMLFDQAQSLGSSLGMRSNNTLEPTNEDHERSISSSESVNSSSANEDHKKPLSHQNIQKIHKNTKNHKNVPSHKSNHSQTIAPIQTTGIDKIDENNTRTALNSSSQLRIVANKNTNGIISNAPIVIGEQRTQSIRKAEELRPLSPIKPLSPMGF